MNNDAHGDAVSAEAKLAKSEHDGDTVGSDVRAVAHTRTSGKTHGHVTSHHTKGMNNDAHGDNVSAAAKAAKLENDGDTVGADVHVVANAKSHRH